jgi:hypothetical protein
MNDIIPETLRRDVETAIRAAVSRHMNNLRPQLPPLTWFVQYDQSTGDPGRVSGVVATDGEPAARVLAEWADALALNPDPFPAPGTAEYAGVVGGLTVRVWGVVDRGAWETGS